MTVSFSFLVRDTAGQERFKTITTAYYRGAMVSGGHTGGANGETVWTDDTDMERAVEGLSALHAGGRTGERPAGGSAGSSIYGAHHMRYNVRGDHCVSGDHPGV